MILNHLLQKKIFTNFYDISWFNDSIISNIFSIQRSPNPGYAKSLIATNIIITTIVSVFLFKSVSLTFTNLIGVLLIFLGIIILVYNV